MISGELDQGRANVTGVWRVSSGQNLILGRALSEGPESSVFELIDEPGLVAQLDAFPAPARAAKLHAMVAHPPHVRSANAGEVTFAWPTDLVANDDGIVVGFLAPKLNLAA